MADTMKKDIDALRKDIDRLKADLQEAAGDSGDFIASARAKLEAEADKLMGNLKSTADSVSGNLSSVGQNVRSMAGSVAEQGEEVLHAAEDHIGRHPTQSVLISFGAGFFIGWLLSRK